MHGTVADTVRNSKLLKSSKTSVSQMVCRDPVSHDISAHLECLRGERVFSSPG